MSLNVLECPASNLANSDTCPRPTAGDGRIDTHRGVPSRRLGPPEPGVGGLSPVAQEALSSLHDNFPPGVLRIY